MEFFNQHKILYHIDRIDEWFKGEEFYPVTLEVDVSNACNHDCIWCTFENFRKSKGVLMPRDILFRLIDDVAQCGVKAIVWTGGGEPLTHPDIMPAIKQARVKGLKSGLFTNGGLIKEDMIDILITHCEFVRISLDSSNTTTHSKVHKTSREAEFTKIIDNIKKLVKKKKELGSNTVLGITFLVHQENYKEISDAAQLAKDLGVDYIQYKPVIIWGGGPQIDPNVFIKARPFLKEAKSFEDNNLKVFIIDYKFNDIIDNDKNYGRTYNKCYGHPFMGTICADGRVYLCCHSKGIDKYCLGDLKNNSFRDIWKSKQKKKVVENINLKDCQPLCKLHEINKLLHFILHPKDHKNFL